MQTIFNQTIQTPIGQGVGQSPLLRQVEEAPDEIVLLVRLPINEQTKSHLHDSNCLTPKAVHSGLWFFQKGEVK